MSLDIRLSMDDVALSPFRTAWEHATRLEAARPRRLLAADARSHYAALQHASVPPYLRAHIDLIPEIAALLDDARWNVDTDVHAGLAGALSYFTDPSDLIPDSQPRFGLLDDAIVIELALDAHRDEWLAWREFSTFRRHHPEIETLDRSAWMQLREDAVRHVQRQRRGAYGQRSYADGARSYASAAALREFEVH